MPTVVWLLNFDADAELAQRKGSYSPTDPVRVRSASLVAHVGSLVVLGDLVLGTDVSARLSASLSFVGAHADVLSRAWCPTPRALAAFERAGLGAPSSPGVDILRRVNGRAFSAGLGTFLPDSLFSSSRGEILDHLARAPTASVARSWLLKRSLSFAGRGRRSIRGGETTAADVLWIDASLRDGDGLQIEPRVERLADFGLHGFVHADGSFVLGRATRQHCDVTGAWERSELAELSSSDTAGALLDDEGSALGREGDRAARALATARYFGPFGIDAFRWKDAHGCEHFQPRCEINARYTMGWAVGMGTNRPDRLDSGETSTMGVTVGNGVLANAAASAILGRMKLFHGWFALSLALVSFSVAVSCSSSAEDDEAAGTAGSSGHSGTAGTSGNGASGAGSGSELDQARSYCVDKINEYRATLGLQAYALWNDEGVCSDGEAQSDAASGEAHGAFGTCQEHAQDECPGWSGSYTEIMDGCLQMMWNEGPGEDFSKHGHYINMSSTQYTKASCGFYRGADGSVWAVQNFQ